MLRKKFLVQKTKVLLFYSYLAQFIFVFDFICSYLCFAGNVSKLYCFRQTHFKNDFVLKIEIGSIVNISCHVFPIKAYRG